jgi:isopropylmalate/homocitrate/citramalate synthase
MYLIKGTQRLKEEMNLARKMRMIHALAVLVGVTVLSLSFGCAKPPTKEMADAEAAVTAAKLAEADV